MRNLTSYFQFSNLQVKPTFESTDVRESQLTVLGAQVDIPIIINIRE